MTIKITYFVHGTTTDNENEISSGWSDVELSELGVQQSIELKDYIKDKHFDVIFCSDLKRAVHSTELTFKGKIKIIQDERLRECNYGDFTRKSAKEFKDDMNKYVETPFPNGESYKDVEKRIADFLEFLKQNYDGKHIAIVAHQAPQQI